MAKRIVDEAFVNDLEQVVERLLQTGTSEDGPLAVEEIETILAEENRTVSSTLGKIIFSSIRPALAASLAAVLKHNQKEHPQHSTAESAQLAENLKQAYVKSGESMAALRDDLISELQLQLKIHLDKQQQHETVYGFDSSTEEFPRFAAALRQLADDAYTRFRLDLEQLEGRVSGVEENTEAELIRLRRENDILRSALQQTMEDQQPTVDKEPGMQGTGASGNRAADYRVLLNLDKNPQVFDAAVDQVPEQPAGALVVKNALMRPENLNKLEELMQTSGLETLLVEVEVEAALAHGIGEPGEWMRHWLEERGLIVEPAIPLTPKHAETQLQPVSTGPEMPRFLQPVIQQINAVISQVNTRLNGARRLAIIARKP